MKSTEQNAQIKIDILKGLFAKRMEELKHKIKQYYADANNENYCDEYRDYAREQRLIALNLLNEYELNIITMF